MKIEFEISSEPSTYRGLAMVFAVGIAIIYPEWIEKITAAGLAVSGLIGIFFKDNNQ